MQRISDTVTSIFHLETNKNECLAACLKGDSTSIVYSEKFGLGWRFGLQYAKEGWPFAKVKVYFDHTHCSSATDAATSRVTVRLKDGSASVGPSFGSKTVTIAGFGHGAPALLGSFSSSDIIEHPYMWFTVTTKANFPPAVADPLTNTASALRQSMNDGAFVDTKYYVMSRRRNWRSPGKTRVLYANNALLTQDVDVGQLGPLPHTSSTFVVPPDGKAIPENTHCLLAEYQSESSLNGDIEQSDYDLDSDIEGEEEEEEIKNSKGKPEGQGAAPPPYNLHSCPPRTAPVEFDSDVSDTASSSALSSDDDHDHDLSSTDYAPGSLPSGFGSTDTLGAEPPLPPPFLQTQRMLVRGTAFTTWASYVYYCYTGQVSFYPLTSKDPSSRRDKTTGTLRCSPKSMYRLAVKLKHARLQALAFKAIKSDLSKSNILDEAFSWFTAQYSDIRKMELELLMEFRSASEVAFRLENVVEAVSQGEKPYARAMLHAFLARLTQLGAVPGGTQ